ncbi:UPF0547 protein C16orf87 homolog [Daktulosphaira vitifoliae]|uniref:UPF0547 protein C16orf87 homolog n=1 Tax=Daktulosphaira vitifoliae TaxID=58002 RepID=UPI0021AAA235|nr:UPF0547 protein C16orf87 homolog [Daktulosphaira vitifoliae]
MLKNKKVSVKKICPGCGQQFPVAVKTCTKCKHSFYLSKKDITVTTPAQGGTSASTSPTEETKEDMSTGITTLPDGRRRTERIRREKPKFYDASAFVRKTRKRPEKTSSKQKDDPSSCRGVQLTQPKKGLVNRRNKLKTGELQDPEDKIYHAIMNEEKAKVCAIILSELNNKLALTSWKP